MNFLHVAKTLNKVFCHMTGPRLIKTREKELSEYLQIADAAIAATPSSLCLDLVPGALRRRLYLGLCFLSIGTAAAMGSGSGSSGGSGGSAESTPLQQEVGSSAFEVYNQGVDLMRAKKFAAAQVKFEQAIRADPDFAEFLKTGKEEDEYAPTSPRQKS